MSLKPDSNSTPSIVPRLLGRKPICKASPLNQYSPIQCISNSNMSNAKEISRKDLNADQFSSDESNESNENTLDESVANDETPINISKTSVNNKPSHNIQDNKETMTNKKVFNISNILLILGIIVGIILYCIVYASNPLDCENKREVTIDSLKTSFPHQDDTFWLVIESGVSEIINFNKPSTIILMYTNASSNIDKLLGEISKYAYNIFNDCSAEPILLSAKCLDTEETKKDYGILIERYGASLHQKHIMIIKDIDKISGTVAQAFHSFCDEYTPLVSRALFLFTVEVDELYADALKQVVDILRTQWSDVDSDKLEPLITRISNMVLQIK